MKTTRLSTVLLISLSLLFCVSCKEKVEAITKPSVVGTWKLTNPQTVQMKFKINNTAYEGSSYRDSLLPITWEFKDNGEAASTNSSKEVTNYTYSISTINDQQLITLINKKTLKQELYIWSVNGIALQLITRNYLDIFPDGLLAAKLIATGLEVAKKPIDQATKMTSVQDVTITFNYTK